jgi:hypothetical protein
MSVLRRWFNSRLSVTGLDESDSRANNVGDGNPYEPPQANCAPSLNDGGGRRGHWRFSVTTLAAIYFVYATCVGFLIYLQPGTFTWVNLAWLPVSLLISAFGSLVELSPLMAMGAWLYPLGSVAAGLSATRALSGEPSQRRGDSGLRLLLAGLLCVFGIPEPFRGTLFYWIESY